MTSVRVLGAVEADGGDGPVALAPQLRRLLGLLVVAGGGVVSPDRLAEYVADGNVEGSTVRTAVSRLRKVLGERVESVSGGYRLVLGPDELDAARFEELVERARSQAPDDRVPTLREALGSWRGPALGEFADEEWAVGFSSRLDSMRATALEELAAALVTVGCAAEALEVLEPHVVAHPYRERPVGLSMQALADVGRVADALRVFERFRLVLRDELGLDPSAELRAVEAELLATPEVATSAVGTLPTGTVTFVFTDIEGSTQRWAEDESAMTAALADHDQVLREVVTSHGGVVFKHTGDGVCAVFASAPGAIAASVEAQGRLRLPVRMGVHTGEAELRDGDYFGPTLNRVARIMDAGHGGQILVSAATSALAPDVETTDLGRHALKGLSSPERLLQVGSVRFPPPRVAATRQGNLPTETTSFVGRDRELADLVDRLIEHRIVTLIGVGGTGKTRLAIEAARVLSPTSPDGCWFAQLAPVVVAEAVPFAVLAGLGVPSPSVSDPIDHLVAQIRHRRLLLVLDNCEHVLSAAADLVEQVIEQCPAVTVVATSREPLLLNGEHLVPVPSLRPADAEHLFAERALAEAPDCLDDRRQRGAVSAICERLDGLPLAIELAASRVRSFTPVELLGMLDERFRVLVGGRRSRMERHQTMRGTLDWSYDLCGPTERLVFDRLSVFPARFTLEQARSVACGDDVSPHDVTDAVSSLVDRSLVQRTSGFDGHTRYGLLETMRAYGRDHLHAAGTLDEVRERHARHVAVLVPSLVAYGPDEELGARRRSELLADALAAVDWFIGRTEWDLALGTCIVGAGVDERALWEMVARVRAAMAEAGCDGMMMRVVEDADANWKAQRPFAEVLEFSTEYLRSGERFGAGVAGLDATARDPNELDELVGCVRARTFELETTRFVREVFLVRHAVIGGVAVADRIWDDLALRTATMRSRTARRQLHEALGLRAMAERRWEDAAAHFGQALPEDDTVLDLGWYQVAARWGLSDACALAGHPLPPEHLLATWEILERHGAHILRERGCVASAISSVGWGHEDLAGRFLGWIRSNDPGGMWPYFAPRLELAGMGRFAASVGECGAALESLIAELRAVAVP